MASIRIAALQIGLLVVGLLTVGGCGTEPASILLVVFDTTRWDAVSAYGEVVGTTPTVDALAAAGLRYTRAYSNAPWTLPSHTTLFTGLRPHEHGVGWQRTFAADELVMLAERLRDAGYDTAGFTENAWISQQSNTTQGFDHFRVLQATERALIHSLGAWLRGRTSERPAFIFLNITDAHGPYRVREENPFLPEGVTAEMAREVSQEETDYVCRIIGREQELAILHGLYLGDVAAADRKLERALQMLDRAGLGEGRLTVFVADHGEHFGEQGLFDHVAGLHDELLRVPLIVHGLPDVAPAVIEEPVQLAAIMPSVLEWVGLARPKAVTSQLLPTAAGSKQATSVISERSDSAGHSMDGSHPMVKLLRRKDALARAACRPHDRVDGHLRTVVRFPYKLYWYERHEPRLFDLRIDPSLRRDLAPTHPQLVAELLRELEPSLNSPRPTAAPRGDQRHIGPGEVPAEVEAGLRALGYLPDEPGDGSPTRNPGEVPAEIPKDVEGG